MHRIEYEIKLNDTGRPCIDLSSDYEDKPEDKFFAIELARYVLQDVYNRRSSEFDTQTAEEIDRGIRLLGQIGDEVAVLLWENMKMLGQVAFAMNGKYHVQVKDIEERDNLNPQAILQGDKLYFRTEGLKVLVTDEMKIYELVNGIENENWTEVI